MEKDAIDEILDQWSEERPDLDTASLVLKNELGLL